jgi:6-pyruvoyltetrahydropterin/6-carboxytetrahydropterin synthase
MYNMSITKEFTWDMAHILAGHTGLCSNLHGHTYRMQVDIKKSSSADLSETMGTENGMVMDFNRFKEIVNDIIVTPLDHSFVYWKTSNDPLEHDIASLLKKHNRKLVEIPFRPTVEQLVIHFFNQLKEEFKKHNIKVSMVRLWETPTSYAAVNDQDNI